MLIFQIVISIYFYIKGIDSPFFYILMILNLIFLIYDFIKSFKKENVKKIFKIGMFFQVFAISLLLGLTYDEYFSSSRFDLIEEILTIESNELLIDISGIKILPHSVLRKDKVILEFFSTMDDVLNKDGVIIEEISKNMELKIENLENVIITYRCLYAIILYLGFIAALFKFNFKKRLY